MNPMKKILAVLLALFMVVIPALADAPAGAMLPVQPTPKPVAVSQAVESFETPRCRSAVLMDGETGEVLYSHNGDEHSFPASITKVMTALLTLEAVDRHELTLDQVVTAQPGFDMDLVDGGSTQNIRAGEEMSVQELLYCMLLPSANESCNILAQEVAGSIPDFIERMNARAAELGMANTHFTNAHGLHNANHYSSAHDLAILVREALKNDTFAAIVSTKSHVTPATNLWGERSYVNTNALITAAHYPGYTYANAIGVKTGTTPEAGQCLASAAVKGGNTLICVVLGSENVTEEDGTLTRYSFVESKRILEWGFDTFVRTTILNPSIPVKEIPVTLSADVSAVALKPEDTIHAILPYDLDPAEFEQVITTYYDTLEAPVEKGQVLGELTVKNGDRVYGTVKLVAAAGAERSELLYSVDRTKQFVSQTWVKVTGIVVGVILLFLIIRFGIFGRRNKRDRYGRSRGSGRSNYTGRGRR